MDALRNGWFGGIALLTTVGLFVGCSDKGPVGPARVPTFPITGQVLVDGTPTGNVQVKLHTEGESAVPTSISAFTDAEGNFSIGTYEGGDGAPVGKYKLTFKWCPINLMTGRSDGPDKLKDRYTDPEKSEITVDVTEGSENNLGTIELTTK